MSIPIVLSLTTFRESTLGNLSSFSSVDEAKLFIEDINIKNRQLAYQLDTIKQDYQGLSKALAISEKEVC